jgi:acyl-CoA thioester hydrolase
VDDVVCHTRCTVRPADKARRSRRSGLVSAAADGYKRADGDDAGMSDDFEADFVYDMQVRFRDIDPMNHVNNAVYATYLEQARAALYRDRLDVDLGEVDTVLAHLEIDFRAPIELEDEVTVALEIGDLGRSSVPMDYEIRADGDVAATGHTVQVVFDRSTGESAPVPDEWRAAFEG